MGQTAHGQNIWKFKEASYNSEDKTSSKDIKINTDLIEYFPKTLLKNKSEKSKHVDNFVSSIQPLPFLIAK